MKRKINIDNRLLAEKLHNKWHGDLGVPMTFEKHLCVYFGTPEPQDHDSSCCSNINCILTAWSHGSQYGSI